MTIQQQFRHAIKRGTGAAYLLLRDNPGVNFAEDIQQAALTNYAYDPQSEGSRANYVAQLIDHSNRKDQLVAAVLQALANERVDTWNLDQLFGLAAIFAKQGNDQARRAIYERYHQKVIHGSPWCGQKEIVALDGLDGLIFIAETRGKALARNPNDWEDRFFVDSFQEEHPDIDVYDALAKAAKGNPPIKKYLDAIDRYQEGKHARPAYTYAVVKENIENKRIIPIPPHEIRHLTEVDIRQLADDFLSETDPDKQEKYLRVFAQTKFPYDYAPILRMAKAENGRANRLVEFACRALCFFSGKDIRQFALQQLTENPQPADYLYLLVANYQKNDYRLLADMAAKCRNAEEIHELVWSYVDIYRVNTTTECRQPLEIMYDTLTCGIHRYDIVSILHVSAALPDRILAEIEFDSYEKTRALHDKIINGSPVKDRTRRN